MLVIFDPAFFNIQLYFLLIFLNVQAAGYEISQRYLLLSHSCFKNLLYWLSLYYLLSQPRLQCQFAESLLFTLLKLSIPALFPFIPFYFLLFLYFFTKRQQRLFKQSFFTLQQNEFILMNPPPSQDSTSNKSREANNGNDQKDTAMGSSSLNNESDNAMKPSKVIEYPLPEGFKQQQKRSRSMELSTYYVHNDNVCKLNTQKNVFVATNEINYMFVKEKPLKIEDAIKKLEAKGAKRRLGMQDFEYPYSLERQKEEISEKEDEQSQQKE